MKILVLAPHPFFQHRGTPIAVKMLIETLSECGYDLHVLTYHEGEDINISNVKTHRIMALPGVRNIKPGPSWKKLVCDVVMFYKCLKMIRTSHFDLIHAVEESAFMALLFKTLYRIPYVYDIDSSISQQIIEKYKYLKPINLIVENLESITTRNSIGVIAVCKMLEDIAKRNCDKNTIILRLEDISLLQVNDEIDEPTFKELNICRPIIMYIGNLEKYQGIDLLLEGFQFALKKVNTAELVIIGGKFDDIQWYEKRSKQLGIDDKVYFTGQKPIEQLSFYLKQADIVVSPRTKGQNTPMKIFSYLDSGKPLLATRLPTHTQVLDDNIALLVPPKPNDFGDGLVSLLQNSKLRENLAFTAKERVKRDFSYEAYKRKLLKFYKAVEKRVLLNV